MRTLAHADKYQVSIIAINGGTDIETRRANAIRAYPAANPTANAEAVIHHYLDEFTVMPLQADTFG